MKIHLLKKIVFLLSHLPNVYFSCHVSSLSLISTLSKPQDSKKLKQLVYSNFNNLKGLHKIFFQVTAIIEKNPSISSSLTESLQTQKLLMSKIQEQLLRNHNFIFSKLHVSNPLWDTSVMQISFTEQESQLASLLNEMKSMTSNMISKVEEATVNEASSKDIEHLRDDYKAFIALCLDSKTYVSLCEDKILPGKGAFLTLINKYEEYWKSLLSPNSSKIVMMSRLTSMEVIPKDRNPTGLTNKMKPLFVLYYSELDVYKMRAYFQIDSFLFIKNIIYKSTCSKDFKTLSKVETMTDFVMTASSPILVTSYSSYSLWSSRFIQKDKKRFLTISHKNYL